MKLDRYLMAAVVMAAVLTGCGTRVEPYHPRGNQQQPNTPGGQQQQTQKDIVAKENKTWQISYGGRKIVDGAYTEEIRVNNVPASQKYLVSVINRANYATYEGNVEEFLKYEHEYNSEYVYQGSPQVIQFGRFRHGTWYAFVIALDADNNLTGEYAYYKFTAEEEEPSKDYLSWLGNWTVSDGRISYDIQLSKEEANQVYRVDGWEIRDKAPSGWVQMDKEYLEASFEPSDGRLYFISQYISTYEDDDLNGDKVDELFLGIIDFDGVTEKMGLIIVEDEGIDLAYAEKDSDESATVLPCDIELKIGKEDFKGKFFTMQYMYQEVKNGNWHYYNDDSVSFFDSAGSPLQVTMVRTKGEVNIPRSDVMRNGNASLSGEDKPLRGKVYQPRSERRAVKAVKL